MRQLIVTTNSSNTRYNTPYMLRQGLEPIQDKLGKFQFSASISNYYPYIFKVSPDQTKVVEFLGSEGKRIPNFQASSTFQSLTTAYSGSIYDCFCSNNYYGFCGDGTLILVFDWATNSVKTIVKTGLGTVLSMSMNTDETLLAITHSNSPYVRIYNTSDQSYYNPTTAGNPNSICCFTRDSNALICFASQNSPYVYSYSTDLTTRTSISTNSSYAIKTPNSNQSNIVKICPHPILDNAVIVNNNNGDSTSQQQITVASPTSIISSSNVSRCYGQAYDRVNKNIITLSQSVTSNSTVAGISSASGLNFDIQTNTRLTDFDTFGRTFLQNYNSIYMDTIEKDQGEITGTVRDSNNDPAERTIRAYRREDGLLVAETKSDATTGDYTVILPTQDTEAYDIQFMTIDGENLNDLFFSKSTPQPVT